MAELNFEGIHSSFGIAIAPPAPQSNPLAA